MNEKKAISLADILEVLPYYVSGNYSLADEEKIDVWIADNPINEQIFLLLTDPLNAEKIEKIIAAFKAKK